MHKIFYTKAFLKQYNKLSSNLKNKAKKAIELFKQNPKNPILKSHKLEGKLKDKYSFSIDQKNRIVFEFSNEGNFILLKIGNHDVYR